MGAPAMSLPQNVASSTPVPAPLLYPDNLPTEPLRDFEMGGIALNDGTQGLQVQPWVLFLVDGDQVRTKPLEDSGDGSLIFTATGITEMSLAFDSNMQPTVAYVQDGVVKLRWFDSLIEDFTITEIADARSPRCTHDDKRAGAEARSDVIFAYFRGDAIYWRQQRDRYEIEYTLATGLGATARLTQVAMNTALRLQFNYVSSGT